MEPDEPNLDEPGKPEIAWIEHEDGTRSPFEIPRSKFENCQNLMGEIRDRLPTDEELARWQLTRREYEHFIMDIHDSESDTLDAMAALEARIEQNTGEKVKRPELEKDRLGFRRLKHPPEETPPTGEPETGGREPPPGTSWGDDKPEQT